MEQRARLPVEAPGRFRRVGADHGEVDRTEDVVGHGHVVDAEKDGVDLRRRPLSAPQAQMTTVRDDQVPRRAADLTELGDLFHGAGIYGGAGVHGALPPPARAGGPGTPRGTTA